MSKSGIRCGVEISRREIAQICVSQIRTSFAKSQPRAKVLAASPLSVVYFARIPLAPDELWFRPVLADAVEKDFDEGLRANLFNSGIERARSTPQDRTTLTRKGGPRRTFN